ncbi:hypothetical protein ACFWY5_38995 [Nonomuraea sp. NPDC059007]|uniref:hypothetical protein n=1 Tax=Nonomuraea sp. NPDC059007 TaxID=3346692 RepID=UPI0036953943
MGELSEARWAEGDPAFLLEEGVGYVREWARAQHSVASVKEALTAIGSPDAMPYLRADVNEFGTGFVELGRVTPQTAALIAQALAEIAARRSVDDECAA